MLWPLQVLTYLGALPPFCTPCHCVCVKLFREVGRVQLLSTAVQHPILLSTNSLYGCRSGFEPPSPAWRMSKLQQGEFRERRVCSEASLQRVNNADAARQNTVAEGLQYRAPQLSWTSQTYDDVKAFAANARHPRCTRRHSAGKPDRAPKRSQGSPLEPSHMHQTCCTKPAVHNTAAG